MDLQLPELKQREKKILTYTVILVVAYYGYNQFLHPFYQDMSRKQTELRIIKEERDKLEQLAGKIEFLQNKLKDLQAQNASMRKDIQRMKQNLMTQGQVGQLLNSLEREARNAKVELIGLDIKTMTEVSKKAVGKGEGEAEGAEQDTVEVTYFKNVIDLIFRSNYKTSARYLDNLLKLPFALSYKNIDMSRNKENPSLVQTELGIEIFFQK